jgi:hypothetical protein
MTDECQKCLFDKSMCQCRKDTMTDNTEPTIDELEQEITNIFITIDNYGTDEEARVDIRKLISDQVAKARIDELQNLARQHWQKPIPEKAILDRIKELNGVNNNE